MGRKLVMYLDPAERKSVRGPEPNTKDISNRGEGANLFGGTYLAANRKMVSLAELADHCTFCLDLIAYSDEYDSIYCSNCDEWRDITCGDPDCDYCTTRPEKPSDMASDDSHL